MKPLVIGRRCPWQNPYEGRVIGGARRQYLDHISPFSERHLLRTLLDYADHGNLARTHQSPEVVRS